MYEAFRQFPFWHLCSGELTLTAFKTLEKSRFCDVAFLHIISLFLLTLVDKLRIPSARTWTLLIGFLMVCYVIPWNGSDRTNTFEELNFVCPWRVHCCRTLFSFFRNSHCSNSGSQRQHQQNQAQQSRYPQKIRASIPWLPVIPSSFPCPNFVSAFPQRVLQLLTSP